MSLFGGKKQGETPSGTQKPSPSGSPSEASDRSPKATSNDPEATMAAGKPASREAVSRKKGETVAAIGTTVVFNGDLSGDEDLEILGQVKGKVSLPSHQLIVGESGRIEAEIKAKAVLVLGRVAGDVEASERVEIQSSGVVEGDVRAPRLLVQEGAVVNGSIEMTPAGESAAKRPSAPAPAPRPVAASPAQPG